MRLFRSALRLTAPAAIAVAAAAAFGYSWFTGAGNVPLIWTAHYTTMHASPNTLPPTSTFGAQFRAGASIWAGNPNSDFQFVVSHGFHDPNYGDLDGANDAYFAPLGYTTLGVTYVYSDTPDTQLWDCDVAFNDYAYNWSPGSYDFQSVAAHELGHVLGLGHTNSPGAVMTPFLSANQQIRVLQSDDLAGEAFLYPKPGGGGPPPPGPGPGPAPLPVRTGTMTGLAVSSSEVVVGDTLTFSAGVQNNNAGSLLLSAAETTPISTGEWEEVLMGAGETRTFVAPRTVADLPGLYPIRLRLGGSDPTMVYVAQQALPLVTVRVRRPPVPVALQDDLVASLGPEGDERIELFLGRGQSIGLEVLSLSSWPGARTLQFLDPEGAPVPRWKPGRPARARKAGVHSLLVANTGVEKGLYQLLTECLGRVPAVRAKGVLAGTGPVEVPFAAWARTSVVLSAKGPKALAPRILALRSPSGEAINLPDGAEVFVEEFGEDGIWTAIVDGAPGVAGKFRVTGRPTWLEGMTVTR